MRVGDVGLGPSGGLGASRSCKKWKLFLIICCQKMDKPKSKFGLSSQSGGLGASQGCKKWDFSLVTLNISRLVLGLCFQTWYLSNVLHKQSFSYFSISS